MLARTAFLMTLAVALCQPLSARTRDAIRCVGDGADRAPVLTKTDPAAAIKAAAGSVPLTAPRADDIIVGKIPQEHARILRQIAVYASVGNRDGVEILSQQLRLSGVNKDTIEEAANWAEFHAPRPSCLAAPPGIAGVEATQ